jgi:hypothetical protein
MTAYFPWDLKKPQDRLFDSSLPHCPNVAKVGGLQSTAPAEGAAVVIYCKPSATPDLESSGFCNIGDYSYKNPVKGDEATAFSRVGAMVAV